MTFDPERGLEKQILRCFDPLGSCGQFGEVLVGMNIFPIVSIFMTFTVFLSAISNAHKIGCSVIAIAMLTACSNLGGLKDPVISSSIGPDVHALATGAERRLVVAARTDAVVPKEKIGTGIDAITTYEIHPNRALLVCAEPSPDAVQALAASISAKIENNATANQNAKAELARDISTSVGVVLKRSQGLQFFRDGIFALCQGSMNGLRDPEAIAHQFEQLRKTSAELIMAEIKTSNWNTPPTIVVAPSSGAPKTN